MNREEIMSILPHRNSMLLIDEAECIDGVAHGKKTITGDEFMEILNKEGGAAL